MLKGRVFLRDALGAEHEVDSGGPDTVVADGREVRIAPARGGEVRVGERVAWTAATGNTRWVFLEGRVYVFELERSRAAQRRQSSHSTGLAAPMPATVVRIPIEAGDRVATGDVLIVLEAMKMELPVRAPGDGIVASIQCRVGELVQPGQDLVEISPSQAAGVESGAATNRDGKR